MSASGLLCSLCSSEGDDCKLALYTVSMENFRRPGKRLDKGLGWSFAIQGMGNHLLWHLSISAGLGLLGARIGALLTVSLGGVMTSWVSLKTPFSWAFPVSSKTLGFKTICLKSPACWEGESRGPFYTLVSGGWSLALPRERGPDN